ncbi:FKBP-type peptidyl-prolyl cis-trans isomerase [Candidatus Woesearchaeota archaeon]|nr:FKBP-type peptidyl-prolyl cis-trans isomerase [Candidatus Woesearchaeota archaeon]
MEEIKKHDFIEIDYLAKIKGTNQIIDLTNENVAKENHLYNPDSRYGPVIICIGENYLIKGLDKNLEGKKIGEYKFEVNTEDAFGRRDPKLIRVVNVNVFLKQKINPFPGLQVNMDGIIGTIRSVSGGRCIVDFNHPLAGRELEYEVRVLRKVNDIREMVRSLLNFKFMLSDEHFEITENNKEVTIKFKFPEKIPDNILKEFEKKAKDLIPGIITLNFVHEKTTTGE